MSTVLIPQPLYAPAPYVAYGTNPAHCYSTPILVSETAGTAYDGLDIRGYATSDYCGKLALYTNCATSQQVVVVYPTLSSPHGFILYGDTCYAFNGTTTTFTGSIALTMAGSVTPVASCLDTLCTKADPGGGSYVYFDNETGERVAVEFPHLDAGIPYFAVAGRAQDGATTLPAPGSARVAISSSTALRLLGTSTGTGSLNFQFSNASFSKTLVVDRTGVQTRYPMSSDQKSLQVQVQTGDIFYLSVVGVTGRVPSRAVGSVCSVVWTPSVVMPRVYDTAVLALGGALGALGFCGLTPYQDYTFYGTLPLDTVSNHPSNPGGLVTVEGADEGEFLVIRNRGSGVEPVDLSLPWYGGENLTAPVTFRFYAVLSDLDAHGEMDAWFGSSGTLPTALRVDAYRALVTNGSSYRKTTEVGDTSRNGVEVITTTTGVYLPRVYGASDGELISVQSLSGTVTVDSKVFAVQGTDRGLAYQIQAV